MSEEEGQKRAEELFAQGASYESVEKETGIKYATLRKLRSKWKDEKQRVAADADYAKHDKAQATFDVEEAPTPVQAKGVVEQALDSLKASLGMKDTTKAPTPLKKGGPVGTKLTAKQQAFVEATAPTLALGFITFAMWAWEHAGDGYGKYLAPDENVAGRIVTPILRIYARHQSFLVDINPDMADVGMCVFAMVGYIHASYNLYEEIKEREKETGEIQFPDRDRRDESTPPENEFNDTGYRRTPLSRRNRRNAPATSTDGRTQDAQYRPNLTDEQSRQHEALLRLSYLDYEHRARRSGRA